MPNPPESLLQELRTLQTNISHALKGKENVIQWAVTSLLAGGHLLIEDVPGVGKTTLAQALASSLGCEFSRIQFTADMLPSDLLGVSVFHPQTQTFAFRKGPLFSQIILADEINRSSPRTQSALLEAMNEKQITVERTTYPLQQPFFVIATQNPLESHGTYPLPDAQLDRFLMRIRIGYPPNDVERQLLSDRTQHHPVDSLEVTLSQESLLALQEHVDYIQFDDALQDYLYEIVTATRRSSLLSLGVSPRGALLFHRAVRAYALVQQRTYVIPDDIKELALSCLAHRILPKQRIHGTTWSHDQQTNTEQILQEILQNLPVPL